MRINKYTHRGAGDDVVVRTNEHLHTLERWRIQRSIIGRIRFKVRHSQKVEDRVSRHLPENRMLALQPLAAPQREEKLAHVAVALSAVRHC